MVLCCKMKCTVRSAVPEDTDAVDRICFLTLDNNDERFREIAGLHWAIPYLRYELEHCFVAVNEDDEPVGYILSSPDANNFRKLFRRRMKKEIVRAFRKKRKEFSLCLYLREYFESTRYLDALPRNLEKEYPAHLHINILPGYQGQGLGVMLMDALKKHLIEIGCSGVHLGVGWENTGAIRFYEKTGFKLLKKRPFRVFYYGIKLKSTE